jgi:hypothetical protein
MRLELMLGKPRRRTTRLMNMRRAQRLQSRAMTGTVQPHPMPPKQTLQLRDRDPLRRDRHHHPGQTRLRLPQLHRLHPLPTSREILRQILQPARPARPRRITAKRRPELRIHQQPLNQTAGAVELVPLSG